MAISLIACALLLAITGVAADICNYQLYPDETQRTAYCSYGCCYSYIYPCCDEPIYVSAAFIAPVVIGSIGLFIVVLVVVVIIVIRRRRLQTATTLQYTTPVMGQQVISTNGGMVNYPQGYNTQYIPQPMYPGQPMNGNAPMYTVQGGPVPMYMNPAPSGPPPSYASQNPEATAPAYGNPTNGDSHATGGADPVPAKTNMQY